MLTRKQAEENLKKYGYNELIEGKKKNVFQIFLEQFKDFLVIILIISAVVSGLLGEMESAIVIFVVITMNAILGTVQTVKAEQSLSSLKKLSAPEAKVIREGELMQIPAREVTIGDEVVIEAGDFIPADGKLLECNSLQVDESALTGESLPVTKSLEDVSEKAALADQTNRAFSGCFVTYGRAVYEVQNIGMNTEMGKIAGLLNQAEDKRTPLQKNLDDFGKKLSIIILIFCGIIFLVNVVKGGEIVDAFLFAVALAVAAIPEALSSIVTIVLSFGTQKMAKEHAIIRKLQAVEGLGSVSVICSDKTGTLTQNKMTVEYYYTDEHEIAAKEICLDNKNQNNLLLASILCNDSSVNEEQNIGDPTETALINLGNNLNVCSEEIRKIYPRISEIPFDSDRKLMSTCHKYEENYIVITKGAVDVLLDRLQYIKINDTVRKITQEDKNNIENQNITFSKNGLRVLAFAYKQIEEYEEIKENQLTFLGLIAMMDPPREESKAAVEECIRAGIKPVMITGDHKITATAIAKRIGILKDEAEACEGSVIDYMSDEELKDFVENVSVYARVSPEHKIRIVRAWQEKGNIVAMTGDGVNDAPALKQADIGVAMGITGSEVSKDAASMVLTDDNFATIVKAVENGRNIYQNIKNSIQFLLSGNFGAILAVLYAAITGLPVPFAPVHLLFINLLTDSLPAIALGLEPHNTNVMKENPRPAGESILTKKYLADIGIEGFIIGALSMVAFFIGYKDGNATLASTMAFGTLCLGRLFHGFNCKAKEPVLFTKKLFNNKYLIGAFVLGAVLITGVMMIPALHGIFKVTTLNLNQLLTVYGLAIAALLIIQLLKLIRIFIKNRK
ncbi:MAG: cation-translocating P-type ATPase [Lachnospiraceae bacterium]